MEYIYRTFGNQRNQRTNRFRVRMSCTNRYWAHSLSKNGFHPNCPRGKMFFRSWRNFFLLEFFSENHSAKRYGQYSRLLQWKSTWFRNQVLIKRCSALQLHGSACGIDCASHQSNYRLKRESRGARTWLIGNRFVQLAATNSTHGGHHNTRTISKKNRCYSQSQGPKAWCSSTEWRYTKNLVNEKRFQSALALCQTLGDDLRGCECGRLSEPGWESVQFRWVPDIVD